MNSNRDYLHSFGITLYEFIPERFRNSLIDSTPPPKFDENGFRRILSSYISKFRNKFSKFIIVNDISLLKDGSYYLLSKLDADYPTIEDKSDDSNRIILMDSDKKKFSLTFRNRLELGQNPLKPLEDRKEDAGEDAEEDAGEDAEEDADETEEDREEDAGETEEDREEDAGEAEEDREEDADETEEDREEDADETEEDREEDAGEAEEDREEDADEAEEDREEDAGEAEEDREEDADETEEDREEDADEAEEDAIEIKLHPNDSKYYDSLPIIKLRTETDDITKEFRVGYSNIIYLEKDKPYGMLLTPIIQGRKIEIFKFE